MRLIFSYLKPYQKTVYFGLGVKIIGTIMDLCIPYILSYIIDVVVLKNQVSQIILWGVLMIACALIGFLGNVYANQKASITAKLSSKRLRSDLFWKIEDLSESQKDEITLPSLVGRMTTDTYNIHQMTGMMQRLGIRAPILLIGGIIVCAIVDPVLTLVMVGILPIIILTIVLMAKKGMPLFKNLQISNDSLVQNVRENATGARIIKALAKEEDEKKHFNVINEDVSKKNEQANIRMSGLNPIITILLNLGLVAVIIIGAYRCNEGLCTKGDMVSFTSYFAIISMAMLNITRLFIVYSKADASAKRVKEVLDLPRELVSIDKSESMSNYLAFNHVSFSYLKKQNNLYDINFALQEKESLGIIGATGSGKTTIVNLLLRFYDPDEGTIYFKHQDIKSFNLTELRKSFGVVFQNDLLFNQSIYENISFGRNLTIEEVNEALKKAQAWEFVDNLPNKAMAIVDSNGSNLSGGQKQRLLIARAIAGNPDIVVLDDSSSALDYQTDALLRHELYNNFKNLIIIAQRISSIKDCTKIIVLDKGKIVGYGTHEKLLDSCSIYKDIAYSQMGVGDNDEC